jgi:uncharacterized protein (DUF433 family)
MASLLDRITVDPQTCGGRPCIRGLRVRVKDILDMLAGGSSRAEILRDYPYLEDSDITAALEFASRATDIRKVDIALKRAARQAAHGTPEKRSGRFLVSSTIKSFEYDDDARELDITFTSGKTYRYFNVPLEIYAEFLDAGSKGKFFNDNIKGAFAFAKVVQK